MSKFGITEETQVKISLGLIAMIIPALFGIGLWVGGIDKSAANVEVRVEKVENETYEELKDINTRLSRIEGALGIHKK